MIDEPLLNCLLQTLQGRDSQAKQQQAQRSPVIVDVTLSVGEVNTQQPHSYNSAPPAAMSRSQAPPFETRLPAPCTNSTRLDSLRGSTAAGRDAPFDLLSAGPARLCLRLRPPPRSPCGIFEEQA